MALVPGWPSGMGGPFFWAPMAFSCGMHLFTQYLELRQLWKNRECMPKEVKALGVEEQSFLESQVYQREKRSFSMLCSWINFAFENLCVIFVTPALWKFSVKTCGTTNECKSTLLFMLLQNLIEKPLGIVESLYQNFVIEERHKFNKMTYSLFATDLVKSELLMYAFSGALVPGLIRLVRWGGKRFHLYVWALAQTLMFSFMWIYPNFIQPLFNKFEPLQDDELRDKIEDLATNEQFPLTKLFQVDGSTRSSHSNAYFFGFWKNKRIVIYDTLLTLSHDQILAVLCHELGHWKFGHINNNIAISSAHIFLLFWSFGKVMYSGDASKNIVQSFGFGDCDAVMISLSCFSALIAPVEQLFSLAMTIFTRANEFQADSFAVEKGRSKELASGLLQMSQENKGDLNPDWLYAWYHFSHPALVERLRAITDLEKKSM